MRAWNVAPPLFTETRRPRGSFAAMTQWPQHPVARVQVSITRPWRPRPAAPEKDLLQRLREAGL